MPLHEIKNCPACGNAFECKAGSIAQCDCTKILLTQNEKNFIEKKYTDCLCLKCLQKIKESSTVFNTAKHNR